MIEGKEFAKLFSAPTTLSGAEFAQKEFASVRVAKKAISEAIIKEAKTGKDYMNVIKGRGGKMARAALKEATPSEEVVKKISNASAKAIAKAKGVKLPKESLRKVAEQIKDKVK